MAANQLSERVTVNGTVYTIVDRKSTSGSGSKFHGRFVYTLSDGTDRFTVYGKRVAWNSKLTPVS